MKKYLFGDLGLDCSMDFIITETTNQAFSLLNLVASYSLLDGHEKQQNVLGNMVAEYHVT